MIETARRRDGIDGRIEDKADGPRDALKFPCLSWTLQLIVGRRREVRLPGVMALIYSGQWQAVGSRNMADILLVGDRL